jgi:hypothetical protein
MVCRLPSHLAPKVLVALAVTVASAAVVRAEDGGANQPDARSQAKRLFDEGSDLYDKGQYDAAIGRFSEAHRLWPDPLMIFAVAQAQRLKGDCRSAMQSYARFIDVTGASLVHEEARHHLDELQVTCVRPQSVIPEAAPPPVRPPAPVVVDRRTSGTSLPEARRGPSRAQIVSGGGGVLLLGVGAGAYLWNTSRMDRWRAEDAWLGSDGARNATASEVWARQDANDALSRSIHRYDQVALGLVIAGTAVLATTVVTYLLRTERR